MYDFHMLTCMPYTVYRKHKTYLIPNTCFQNKMCSELLSFRPSWDRNFDSPSLNLRENDSVQVILVISFCNRRLYVTVRVCESWIDYVQ